MTQLSTQPSGPTDTPMIPRGLYTLFFTEMWERFSYYGMRALLFLFMVNAVGTGGLGLTDKTAGAIYGLYTAGVYLAALPGGWVADRLLGAQQAVWYGGLLIAAGHFSLAIPRTEAFYFGMILLVAGTGLLKPNISTMVGQLYPEGGARRDAGFTIFYMGINLGATIGPLICGALGQKVNWHYGFGAAGVGMVLGLIQYRLTARHLGQTGRRPERNGPDRSRDWRIMTGALAGMVLLIGLIFARMIPFDPIVVARGTTYLIIAMGLLYFAILFVAGHLNATEKKRVAVIAILFVSSAMFWSGFEQAGSSLNVFAERHTLLTFFNWQMPASWLQSLNPIFIIALAPVVASVWLFLGRREIPIPVPVKFAIGLLLVGGGFFLMALAASKVVKGHTVWPTWLIVTYFLHSMGELCLSPVGLSSVTKLAPQRFVGQMMGIWFLATSLGNLIAGLIAGEMGGENVNQMPSLFMHIVWTTGGMGLLLILFSKPIKKLMSGAE